jgi:hypothetical protein
MGDPGVVRGEGFDWEGTEDLTALSEEELRGRLEELVEEERSISYRRRILQGRIDLIRAELVGRGAAALGPEALARVLLGELSGKERGRP